MSGVEREIFKKGSTTYYFSSRFFPKSVRDDVFRLYSFVRVADDYVDAIPQQATKFKKLRKNWEFAAADPQFSTRINQSDSIDNRVIKNLLFVYRKYDFRPEWVDAFLNSMQADLDQKKYHTLRDSLWYVYGSAEVIGLMMAQILGLPEQSQKAAQLQGRAMQWINFIRDINEDIELGRCYFSEKTLKTYGLKQLTKKNALASTEQFTNFIRQEINRYRNWQMEANEGYQYIPKRYRLPQQTARDMYNWTADQIYQNPMIVFEKKVKPTKQQVLTQALKIAT